MAKQTDKWLKFKKLNLTQEEVSGAAEYGRAYIRQYQRLPDELYCHLLKDTGYTNPWVALASLGIQDDNIVKSSRYKCPWSDISFFGIVPFGISALTEEDKKKSAVLAAKAHNPYDASFDEYGVVYSPINLALLGHGYSYGLEPDDGGATAEIVELELEDGRIVYALTMIWYNK